MLETPVVFIIFNRPDVTALTFRAIAKARPKRLFILADGPRSPDEEELCAQTRAVVTESIDWDCELTTDFSELNLGCKQRSVSGFDWVFSQVDEAIFLEDDCLPDTIFFRFCEEMLEYYRDDMRVMMINGSNYLERWKSESQSYHFSNFGSPWGWATWKRAWKFNDITMKHWGHEDIKLRIRDVLANEECFSLTARRYDKAYNNPKNRHTWDLQWMFARQMQSGLTIVPAVNLISNQGAPSSMLLPTAPMSFPLQFQRSVSVDRLYDLLHIRWVNGKGRIGTKYWRLWRKFRKALRRSTQPIRGSENVE
ncbi:MAG: glycosyltransferase family 2 protein [Gammaproteobacteria bacterium]|nr:glycosyltransferase family 2 protein [Gammaproteobacteria bacterium]